MKVKNILHAIIAMSVLCLILVCVVSCGGGADAEITGISLNDAAFTYDGTEKTVEITGTLPEGVTVSYENNKAINAGTYNVTATLSGDGYKTAVLTATLSINKAQITGISFPNGSYVYDGSEKTVEITGTLPEGVTVSYEGNKATNAGTHLATATLEGANYATKTLNATINIRKADISGVTFPSRELTYNGNTHTLTIEGSLPPDVSVTYENNSATNAGTYLAVAKIGGNNYNELTLTATLTVNKADFSGISLSDKTVTYDGNVHSLAVEGTLPAGATVSYSGNGKTDAGVYPVIATVSCKNYNDLSLPATITIVKADFKGITLPGKEVVYDGNEHKLAIAGELPAGAKAVFTNNSATNAGIYTVIATISCKNYNDLTLSATLNVKKAQITGVTLTGKTVVYDGNEHTVTIEGDIPDGATLYYENNSATEIGTYVVKVTVTHANYEDFVTTAVLEITEPDAPVLNKITGITFDDVTYTYDGEEKTVEIKGELPEGVSVSYTDNTGKNAGTYNAVATLSGDGYESLTLTATLKINRGKLEGISFDNKVFDYDGEKKTIEISGTLPDGVTISYKNNSATASGTYSAVATLTSDNYETLVLYATLKINDKAISGITFEDATFLYDGQEKIIEIKGELPTGVSVSYSGNAGTNANVYNAVATISGEGYETLVLKATLTISKASLEGIITIDSVTNFTYDGKPKTVLIKGTLPEGVIATYYGNVNTEVGTYEITVVISGDNYETLELSATMVIKAKSPGSGGLVTPPHVFG